MELVDEVHRLLQFTKVAVRNNEETSCLNVKEVGIISLHSPFKVTISDDKLIQVSTTEPGNALLLMQLLSMLQPARIKSEQHEIVVQSGKMDDFRYMFMLEDGSTVTMSLLLEMLGPSAHYVMSTRPICVTEGFLRDLLRLLKLLHPTPENRFSLQISLEGQLSLHQHDDGIHLCDDFIKGSTPLEVVQKLQDIEPVSLHDYKFHLDHISSKDSVIFDNGEIHVTDSLKEAEWTIRAHLSVEL